MLAADVPVWFAAITLLVPAATALLTQLITNRQNHARMTHEATEHDKDRGHAIRIEVLRELRAERISLYGRLIKNAKFALWIDQPIAETIRKTFAKLERERQGLSSDEPLENDFVAFDAWRDVLTEVELVGSPAVKEAARAVDSRVRNKLQRDADRRAIESESGEPWQYDAAVEDDYVRVSRELIEALTQACSDDLGAHERSATAAKVGA